MSCNFEMQAPRATLLRRRVVRLMLHVQLDLICNRCRRRGFCPCWGSHTSPASCASPMFRCPFKWYAAASPFLLLGKRNLGTHPASQFHEHLFSSKGYRNCRSNQTSEENSLLHELCFHRTTLLCLQQVVPKSMAPFLPSSTVPAMLTWRGRSWDMRFTGGRQIQRLEAGWRSFALDNGLRLGDGCVFELMDGATEGGTVKFSVQVLRGEIPLAIRERAGGYTSSSPIEIE